MYLKVWKNLWWGTQKEKLPRGPTGRDMASFVFFEELAGAGLGHQDFWWPQVPCPSVKEGRTNYGKSASCPSSSPGGASASALWCLSGLCSSSQWGHPGSWMPLIQLSLHPLPFVLLENDGWPSCFLRGWHSCCEADARCRHQGGWACPSPTSGWGLWMQVGSPRRAAETICVGGSPSHTNVYLHTHICTLTFVMTKPAFFPLQWS